MHKAGNKADVIRFLDRPITHVLMIMAVGLIAYSNTLHVPFLLDDQQNIVTNPIIRNLPDSIDPSSPLYHAFKIRFIGYLSFALNYRIDGLNVIGFHIFNIAIHIINAVLVYWLVRLTFITPHIGGRQNDVAIKRGYVVALFSALLFVAHPIQTQAVTYIVQRLTSLATLFYLFSLVMYIKARLMHSVEKKFSSAHAISFYLFSIISAAFAMKTKEIAFTLPVIIALYEFMFFEDKLKTRIALLAPLILTMLIIPFSLLVVDKPMGSLIGDVSNATRVETDMSRWDYLFTQFRVIITYIRLLIFPVNQNLDYDYPKYYTLLNYNVLFSLVFLLSLFALAIFILYRSCRPNNKIPFLRLIPFGIFWFFITLSIESSIIPIKDVIFEHRVYLPSVGFFVAIVTAANIYYEKLQKLRHAYSAGFFLVIFILTLLTYKRNQVWESGISLWKDTIEKSPNLSRPHIQLGQALIEMNLWDEAQFHFAKARELTPSTRLSNSHAAIGLNSLDSKGILNYNILQAKKEADKNPNESSHITLGRLYADADKFELAIEQFKKALEHNSKSIDAFVGLGVAYSKQEKINEAIAVVNKAAIISPDSFIPHNYLGYLYFAKLHRNDLAVNELKRAIAINPKSLEAHKNLAIVYSEQGNLDKAIYEYQKHLGLNDKDEEVRLALGQLFEKKKLIDPAFRPLNTH
jgi:tetratricopeptide (TPR) repeat protein